MATSDPHMDELALMSYEPRSRQCKDLYRVPAKGNHIEVLWCMDDLPGMPDRWCTAEVLHVSGPPEQWYLAKGVIRYIPSERWGEQFHFVDFLDRHKLRCSVDDEAWQQGDGCDIPGNGNPDLLWRFSSEPRKYSNAHSDDESWCAGHEDSGTGSHEISRNPRRLTKKQQVENFHSGCANEMGMLRSGHAALTVEMEKLKRELVRVSHSVESMRRSNDHYFKCTSSSFVLPRLRQKLALRMQASLKQAPARLGKRKRDDPDHGQFVGYADGFHPGVIKARVECTLKQFESLSLEIRAKNSSNSIFFSPDFAYTQLPLQCSAEFRILFQTFSQLCDCTGIVSSSDKREMARKCGAGSQGELLRILGTYCYDEGNDKHPAILFPGTSCGDLDAASVVKSNLHKNKVNSEDNKADPPFPILVRKTREWNRVDSRFRYGLKKEEIILPQAYGGCSEMKAFALVWKRATDLGGKAWSEALCNSCKHFSKVTLEKCLGGWKYNYLSFRPKESFIAKSLVGMHTTRSGICFFVELSNMVSFIKIS